MKKNIKNKEVYKFKKGQYIHLDCIYKVQGLAGGDWWEREDNEDDFSDDLRIRRDVHFEIIEYETSKN